MIKKFLQKLNSSRRPIVIMCYLLFGSTGFLLAQTTVSGNITSSSDNTPLPGVNVVVKGTSVGTVTDAEGNFTIESPADGVLVFSFIGYTSEEVPVNGRSAINLTLAEDVKQLGEVVIIGYGTQRERDLTSAISTVKSEEIVKTPTAQAMQALQGKVAGVQIVSNGAPGASPTVRVRGVGSFEGKSAPLYVVDGMFFDNIDFLNTNDIATISVLKDASASAIYGVRAANGVVLIETKSGAYNQKPEIVYDGYYGIQNPQNVIKMANTQQFVQYINETGSAADISFINNAMQRYGRSRVDPNIPNVNTDWYKEIMQPATIQNHNLSFNGGSERTRYSIGGSYFSQDGLLKHTRNEFQRLNFRLKVDNKVTEWLTTGGSLNVSTARQYIGDDAAWFNAYFAVPIMPVYDEQNATATPAQLSNARQLGYRSRQNPFFSLLYNDDRNQIGKVLGNFYLNFEIVPQKLSFKTSYNYSLEGINARNVDFAFYDGVASSVSAIKREHSSSFDQIWDNYLTYQNNFGLHNLTLVGGYSFRSEYGDLLFARGEQIDPDPDRNSEQFWYISNAQNIDINDVGDASDDKTFNNSLYYASFFGRLAYNYDDRYLIYSTFRRDGNNKFQEKYGDFFTIGAGWVISEESFFNVNFINFLKFRGSWGELGNDAIKPAVGAPTIEDVNTAIDNVLVVGRRLKPTFDLIKEWETTVETNLGLTANLLNNRLSLEADYFIRDRRNAAVSIIPPVFRDTERRSVGEIRNKGLEVSLTWNDKISDNFTYFIGGNIATLKNEILNLGGPASLTAGSDEFRQLSRLGDPFEAFYGYEIEGVFQNESQITSSGYTQEFITQRGLVPGDFFYKDQNSDGLINDEDRVILGTYIPSLSYGANAGFSFQNFSFSVFLQGQVGHSILNRRRGEIIFTNDTNIDADLANNLWRGEGTSNKYPSASGLRRPWNLLMSDYYVEDGSFFRIQNVQLAYNIVNSQLFGANMPATRIILTAERPLTVFKYNGFTPEVPNGVDRQTYPIPAVYTVGINVRL